MHLIAKSFSIDDFKNYVQNLKFDEWLPKFVVVHNTSVPTQELYKKWHDKANWTPEQWLHNLASYYAGMGWNGTPHLFVAYDKICVLNDLTFHGTHSPSWNAISWGVETVAEFESEPFDNGVKENLIAALGILHSRIGLDPENYKLGVRGLHFHKEDVNTTHKDCPGKNLIKVDLVQSVVDYMDKNGGAEHLEIPEISQTADTSELTKEELTSIVWVQQKLGFAPDECDGIAGEQTKRAVKLFQEKHNLNVDGIAGPVTRLAIKENSNATV